VPEGLEYVVATFVVTAATLALWFGLIAARFRTVRRLAAEREQARGGQAGEGAA
jgi:hypothetical protein